MSNGMVLTDKGKEVLILALAGEELHFTRGAVGDGQPPEDMSKATRLVNEKLSLGIHSIKTKPTGTVEVTLRITNEDLITGMWLREFGLFATNPETDTEILYAYCNKGNTAGYLEGFDGANPIDFKLKIVTVVDQAKNITVEIDSTDLERLEDRVGILEQAFAGLTPPQVKDRLKELTILMTWDSDTYSPDFSTMTPDEVADCIRHLNENLSWAESA